MFWHSTRELEQEGRPGRKELLWVVLALPLLLTQLAIWTYRVFQSFDGQPLIISDTAGIVVHRSAPLWQYVGGLTFYLVLMVLNIALVWACALQIQRWLYWRGRS